MSLPTLARSVASEHYALRTALLGEIELAVAERPSPRVRSVAIAGIVDNIYQTLAWLHDQDLDHAELVSMTALLEAARAHEARMARLELDAGSGQRAGSTHSSLPDGSA